MDVLLICKAEVIRNLPSRPFPIAKRTVLFTSCSSTILDLYHLLCSKHSCLSEYGHLIECTVSHGSDDATISAADLNTLTIADLKQLNSQFSTVVFLVAAKEKVTVQQANVPTTGSTDISVPGSQHLRNEVGKLNAFEIMVASARRMGGGKDLVSVEKSDVRFHGGSGVSDAKNKLAEQVVGDARVRGLRVFRRSVPRAATLIRDLCNFIWKIDGHLDKIENRKCLPLIAQPFRKFIGNSIHECIFRKWNLQKKAAPVLSVEDTSRAISQLQCSLDSLVSTNFLPCQGARRVKAENYLKRIQGLVDSVLVYLDHVNDTANTTASRSKQIDFASFAARKATGVDPDVERMKTGIIEAFVGSHCYFHNDIAPLLEDLSASPMYTAIVVDFDEHAVAGTGLWSLQKSGVTSKRYAAAAAVRHARSRMRANIFSYGLPHAIGFYEEVVPGPVGTLLALWKVPDSADTRSDLRQNSAVMFASSRVKHFLSRHQTAIYSRCIVEIGKSKGSLKISSATALLEAFGFSHHKRSDADDCRVAKALSAILSYSSQLVCCDDKPTLDLAQDLRNYNHKKKGPLLKAFFSAAADYLNHAINSTGAQVDQRRASSEGGARMYMPIALSLQDLMNSIKTHAESVLKLKINTDFILPSLEWLRLQFQPPRRDNLTAAKLPVCWVYTEQFKQGQ